MRQIIKGLSVLLLLTCFSFMNPAYAADEAEKRLNRIVEEYMNIKDALVHERTDLSGPWAERLETTLATTRNEIFDEEAVPDWQAFQAALMDAVGDMIENDELDIHREALARLSVELREMLETLGNPAGELYVFSCNDLSDDIWLNNSENVANPYHGRENINCGEIIAQL
jgi:hypothetical protein